MLQQLLKTIQTGDAHSLGEIAQSMHISVDMALQMIKELTNKGYLQEINADCNASKNACSECPANNGCHILIRQWLLTEKGGTIVSGLADRKN